MQHRPWTPNHRDALLGRVSRLTAGTAVVGTVGAVGLAAGLGVTASAAASTSTSTTRSTTAQPVQAHTSTGSDAASSSGSSKGSSTTSSGSSRASRAALQVQVLNGSGIQGAAAAEAQRLTQQGFTVVGIGNAPRVARTLIAVSAHDIAGARTLADATGVGPIATADTNGYVVLILGPDWTGSGTSSSSSSSSSSSQVQTWQPPAPSVQGGGGGPVVASGGS